METTPEGNNSQEGQPESLVERKRQAAFVEVCRELSDRITSELGNTFALHGKEYDLTSAEDCMVANAQNMRQTMRELYNEVLVRDDYYEEKAAAKLLELFRAYERLVSLYAELSSYYPSAAAAVAKHIPLLEECITDAEALWQDVKAKEKSD